MKKLFALAAIAMLALTACSSNAGSSSNGVNGTFEGTGRGMGEVKASVTFENSKITAVTLDCSGETAGLGDKACEALVEAIIAADSADVDAVAGATVTSDAVYTAVSAAIEASGR